MRFKDELMNKEVRLIDQTELGARICYVIKRAYYDEQKWSKIISDDVIKKFNMLKAHARIYYPDKNDEEILHELNKYNTIDIIDALEK